MIENRTRKSKFIKQTKQTRGFTDEQLIACENIYKLRRSMNTSSAWSPRDKRRKPFRWVLNIFKNYEDISVLSAFHRVIFNKWLFIEARLISQKIRDLNNAKPKFGFRVSSKEI